MFSTKSPNRTIVKKIEENGVEVNGYSNMGISMNKFSSFSKKQNDLFSFLIENNLNRYLFGVFLRLGTLDVNDLPFTQKFLDSTFIEQIAKESFIKKFNCKTCNRLLFRKHLEDIELNFDYEYECPYCDKTYTFNYQDLENDYELNRKDLIKFLNRLNEIEIIDKNLKCVCLSCGEDYDYDLTANNIVCECGSITEVKNEYSFENEFFKSNLKLIDGRWFEWYVFNICKHIYKHADHNILISYEKDGIERESELDVVAIDKEDNLLVFECKDYLKGDIDLKEMNGLRRFSSFFDNIFLVSSSKRIKRNSRIEINALCDKEINFIEGTDLENQFLSEERVLEILLKDSLYRGVHLFQKLNDIKKFIIVNKILDEIINSNGKKVDYISIMTEILGRSKNIGDIIRPELNKIKSSVKYCFDNIKNGELIPDSTIYIRSVFNTDKTIVLAVIDLDELFEEATKYLSPISDSGYKERAPFYYFICDLFNKVDIKTSSLNEKIMQSFLLKFIPMLNVYYGTSSRKNTLNVIEKLWQFKTKETEKRLVSNIGDIKKDPSVNSYVKYLGDNLLKKIKVI